MRQHYYETTIHRQIRNKRENRKERIAQDISKYGEDILSSRELEEANAQKHHLWSTVGEHSLRVTASSLMICYALRKLHIPTNIPVVVIAALCHDLGILGREKKYANEVQCCQRHPGDSVLAFRALTEEEDPLVEDAIAHHMWPLTFLPPRHREGFILTLADKISSCMERTGRPPSVLLGLTREVLEADA